MLSFIELLRNGVFGTIRQPKRSQDAAVLRPFGEEKQRSDDHGERGENNADDFKSWPVHVNAPESPRLKFNASLGKAAMGTNESELPSFY